ncbi:MAG: class III lanthionine synthetase LanKC [Actinomycetaceae bacterium]|nr:class III lanthionine synthetase LanKC [Actinomycetaceae bacterium]
MPIDVEYIRYCSPDSKYYCLPTVFIKSARFDEEIAGVFSSDEWLLEDNEFWTMVVPQGCELPNQGWKIHVSSVRDRAASVLREVADYCCESKVPFKFLKTIAHFDSQNSKYADRASAGKFITLYPLSCEQFERCLLDLELRLQNEPGPYILTDHRWGQTNLYYRYGAFRPAPLGSKYASVLRTPDNSLVEDVRRPVYSVPAWVEVPSFIQENEKHNTAEGVFPFKIQNALHFSNGGGVYLAETATDEYCPAGTKVVLKEARPFAAIDAEGRDAVDRLRHEAKVLKELQGLDYVPQLYGELTAWEHHFMVTEYIEGLDLKRSFMAHTPILKPYPWNLNSESYKRWFGDMTTSLGEALDAFHERGWLVGDIHPKNIIVRNLDGKPIFIDWEFARRLEDTADSGRQGAPGFVPPPQLKGEEAEKWSFSVLLLDMIFPQAMLIDQGNEYKVPQLVDFGASKLGIERKLLNSASQAFKGSLDVLTPDIFDIEGKNRDQLIDHYIQILARGTLDQLNFRSDPVLPRDIQLFKQNAKMNRIGYPFGLAGALGVLSSANIPISAELMAQSEQYFKSNLGEITGSGLSGKEGVLYGLRQAHMTELVKKVQEIELPLPIDDHSYFSGLSGVGLYQFTCENPDFELIASVDHSLRQLLIEAEKKADRHQVGLLYGWSPAALFWVYCYESLGDYTFLDFARRAIALDLRHCGKTINDTLEYDENWRTLPYLGVGSVFVGYVIREFLKHRDDELLNRLLSDIHKASTYYQYGQAGYAYGLAGFLAYYGSIAQTDVDQIVIDEHLCSLSLHMLRESNGGASIRGNQTLRISHDFLTGGTGVISALLSLRGTIPAFPMIGLPWKRGG